MFGSRSKKEKVLATKTTTQFIDHVVAKNNTARLIELGTLLTNLNNEKNQLEKIIDSGNLEPEELEEKIEEFNDIANAINESIKERAGLTDKESLIKPIQKREFVKRGSENKAAQIPNNQPEGQLANLKNEKGEPNTVTDKNLIEIKHEDNRVVANSDTGKQRIPGEVQPDEISHPIVLEDNGPIDSDNNLEEDNDSNNPDISEPEVTEDEFMKQLEIQMENMLEIEKKIQEIKEENAELEKFIEEQEEIEKEKILKEEALKVIKQAKKAKIKRDDPKLNIFDKSLIDEVYGKEK